MKSTKPHPFLRSVIAAITLCALLVQFAVEPRVARADDFWNEAKDYSAGLAKAAATAAAAAVAAAAVVLSQRMQELESARAVLEQAKTLAACTEAAAIVAECAELVAAAKIAYAAAVAASHVALAVAAGIAVGTVIGEAADWAISRCWDPPCVMHASSPSYTPPSDAQIDVWLPDLLQTSGASILAPTRAEFDSADVVTPGSGTAAWNFIHSGVRLFCVATEGAGSSTAHLCSDVSSAAGDIQFALNDYMNAINAFTPYLESATIYSGDPRPQITAARARAADLIAYINANPTCFTDPATALNAATQTRDALGAALSSLDSQSISGGSPRPLQGASGFYPNLSLTDFQQFLADCASNGMSALPPGESATVDTLLARLGLRFYGVVGAGWDIAAYVGEGDLGDEASLFSSGPLTFSQILSTSISHHWSLVNPFASPTLLNCTITAVPSAGVDEAPLALRVESNPVIGAPVFWVSLRQGSQATVRVYGVSGAMMGEVYSGYLTKGTHRFEVGGSGRNRKALASGSYYVRVTAGRTQETRRFSIVR